MTLIWQWWRTVCLHEISQCGVISQDLARVSSIFRTSVDSLMILSSAFSLRSSGIPKWQRALDSLVSSISLLVEWIWCWCVSPIDPGDPWLRCSSSILRWQRSDESKVSWFVTGQIQASCFCRSSFISWRCLMIWLSMNEIRRWSVRISLSAAEMSCRIFLLSS